MRIETSPVASSPGEGVGSGVAPVFGATESVALAVPSHEFGPAGQAEAATVTCTV